MREYEFTWDMACRVFIKAKSKKAAIKEFKRSTYTLNQVDRESSNYQIDGEELE